MPIIDVEADESVLVYHPDLVNLYGCSIGARTKVGAFVEVQRGAQVGSDCKISSHSFICEGVKIGSGVFIGHGVIFTNDLYPRALNASGSLQTATDWTMVETIVENGVSIGSGAVILAGVTVGRDALIGAGAVVTSDVSPRTTVAGVPARLLHKI